MAWASSTLLRHSLYRWIFRKHLCRSSVGAKEFTNVLSKPAPKRRHVPRTRSRPHSAAAAFRDSDVTELPALGATFPYKSKTSILLERVIQNKKKQVLLGQTGLVGFAATSPKRAKSAPGRDQLGLRHLRQLLRSQQGGGRGDRLSLPPMGSLQEPQMVDSQDHPNHPTIWVSCLGAPGPSQAGPSNPLRRYSWKPSLNTGTHWDLSLGFRELAFPLPHMGHRNVRDPPPPPPTSQSTWVSYRSLTSPSGNDQP